MYGVNSGVKFHDSYGYGKNSPAQTRSDRRSADIAEAMVRTDEILFSSTHRKRTDAVSSLSEGAKNLLADLKQRYKGYDFMVADYESDEEASRLLSQGKGEYNVLITPELLEKMASNKGEREKYENIITKAADKFGEIEKNLTEGAKAVVDKLGFTVDADGKVNFFASLTDGTEFKDKNFVKASLIKDLADTVNKIAKGRDKLYSVTEAYRKRTDALSNLSDGAKKLLDELKEKYKGYDFIVADYKTDEEASRLLSSGKGEYNVLITPELLEKMASNKGEREKYEGIIAGAKDKFDELEKSLSKGGMAIIEKLGFSVNADGGIDFIATLTGGIKTDDGKSVIKSSLVKDLAAMVNTLASDREKLIEEAKNKDNTPISKEEQKEKSVLPPKSFEKYKREDNPYTKDDDYGNLPPESFEKYAKEPNPYSTEEDYGNLPPESFEKYMKEPDPYSTEEDYGGLPPESFKKYLSENNDRNKETGTEMNYTV